MDAVGELRAVSRILEATPRGVVARNIIMEYDRKSSDILKLVRAFTKQLDRHRAQMMSGGYEDTAFLSDLIEVETALNEMMRKLG